MIPERPAVGAYTESLGSTNGHAPLEPEHFTDLGNARRLVAAHGQDLRYVPAWDTWLVWDSARWAKDETGEVLRRAKETVRGMYAEAGYAEDDDYRRALTKHAVKSESERALRAMVALAQSEPGIPVTVDRLDADPWLLNVLNGTVDLHTGELVAPRREALITKLMPVPYDPGAVCPTWLAFLDRVMASNAQLIGFLHRFMGYALTGDTSEQVLAMFWGGGGNGKTTLVGTATTMLGDYARHTPIETLLATKSDGPRNDLARLHGARLVAAVEADNGKRLDEARIKQLTGGDAVVARFLYREYSEFVPSFKLILATNHKPVIRGTDHAIWRRIRLVPFTVTIPPEEQDRDLPRKLRDELPGILRWAVDGCLAWQRQGLGVPEEVRAATETYRAEMDVLGEFVAERCVQAPDATSTSAGLWRAYTEWCQQAEEKPLGKRAFARALAERGARSVRTNAWRGWQGIRLRGPDDESEPAWLTEPS